MVTRAWILALGMLLAAQGVGAQSTADTSAHADFEQGLEALRAQRWVDAERFFRSSLALSPRPSTRYDLAFVLFKLGRMRESADCLRQLLHDAEHDGDPAFRDSATALLSEVLSQLAMVYLSVEPADAHLTLDGKPVPLGGAERTFPVDPGPHEIAVSAPGFVTRSLSVRAAARSTTREVVRLWPLLAASPVPKRGALDTVGPPLLMGLGAASLIAAAISYGLARHADDQFSEHCPSHRDCNPLLLSERDKVVHLRTAFEVLLISGAALASAGAGWYLLAEPSVDAHAQGFRLQLTLRH